MEEDGDSRAISATERGQAKGVKTAGNDEGERSSLLVEQEQGENDSVVGVDDDDDKHKKYDMSLLDLTRPENLAIPVFYFVLGFTMKFPYVSLRQYMRMELKAEPATQALITGVIMSMPWNFKMIYAFISDSVPICGLRRKPYMIVGVILCSLSWLILGLISTQKAPTVSPFISPNIYIDRNDQRCVHMCLQTDRNGEYSPFFLNIRYDSQ